MRGVILAGHSVPARLSRLASRSPGLRVRTGAVLLVNLVYAVCYVTIKGGLPYAPPLLFGGLRALIAGSVILGVAPALGVPMLPRDHWRGTLLLGATATTLTYGGMFLSVGWAGAGIAAVLGNLQPLLAVLLGAILLDEHLQRRTLAAVALGGAGVVAMALPGLVTSPGLKGAGDLVALSASLGSALGSVIVKRMALQRELLAVTGWQFVLGSVPLLLLGGFTEPVGHLVWSPAFLAILLFLALVGTALTALAWFWLLRYEPVGRLSLFLLLTPVLGLALGALAFGERILPTEVTGAVLIVSAMALLVRHRSADAAASG